MNTIKDLSLKFILSVIFLIPLNGMAETLPPIEDETERADLEPVEQYMGHWKTEETYTTQEGRKFHFEYTLNPYDSQGNIVRLEITQVFSDGETALLWEGYKGWNPLDEETFYQGFSPLGRVATGKVKVIGNETVTFYEAFNAEGEKVFLRDYFGPVEDGQFGSKTYFRPAGTDEWRQIGNETWIKVE